LEVGLIVVIFSCPCLILISGNDDFLALKFSRDQCKVFEMICLPLLRPSPITCQSSSRTRLTPAPAGCLCVGIIGMMRFYNVFLRLVDWSVIMIDNVRRPGRRLKSLMHVHYYQVQVFQVFISISLATCLAGYSSFPFFMIPLLGWILDYGSVTY